MEQVVHAMDLFRPALWRIKSFRLSVPNRPQAHAVLLRCQEDAPLLEVLSIRIYHAMQDDNYSLAPLPLFNGRTPRLRSCSLTSFNFGWDVRLVSRLRVLKLGGYFNAHTPSTNTLLGSVSSHFIPVTVVQCLSFPRNPARMPRAGGTRSTRLVRRRLRSMLL
jgi:hypothetical protein